jgi:energy-coupling factor transporter ATP-binding protein EcfA2
MWSKPHVIALDEPTNYLDNETLQALTAALKKFKGGVLVVSHNAGFVADLCTDSWRVYQAGLAGLWSMSAHSLKPSSLHLTTLCDVGSGEYALFVPSRLESNDTLCV